MNDVNHHLIVCEIDGKIVASCVCVIIPNLTRNVRPYAFVENVVTHGEYRKKGYATDCLNFAKKIAEEGDRSQGAIASVRAAEEFGLTVLQPKINQTQPKLLLVSSLFQIKKYM